MGEGTEKDKDVLHGNLFNQLALKYFIYRGLCVE